MQIRHNTNPKKIGDFLIGKTIGCGTFGKVKSGIHMPTGKQVAIKILQKQKISHISDLTRVHNELTILFSKINHPNILKLLELHQTGKQLYIVTEFIQGKELYQMIVQEGSLSAHQCGIYLTQLLSAVQYLHQNNISHRDIKPQNIIVHNNTLKLIDFGLSKQFQQNSRQLQTACGSPCYAAPQMITGQKYDCVKSDVWAIGVTLYAMAAGCLPFQEEDTDRLYQIIGKGKFKPLSEMQENGDISKGYRSNNKNQQAISCINNLLTQLLQTNPQSRPTISQLLTFSTSNPWLQYYHNHMHSNKYNQYQDDTLLLHSMSKIFNKSITDILQIIQKRSIVSISTYYWVNRKYKSVQYYNKYKNIDDKNNYNVRHDSCELYNTYNNNNRGNVRKQKSKSKSRCKVRDVQQLECNNRFFNSPGKKIGQTFLLHNPQSSSKKSPYIHNSINTNNNINYQYQSQSSTLKLPSVQTQPKQILQTKSVTSPKSNLNTLLSPIITTINSSNLSPTITTINSSNTGYTSKARILNATTKQKSLTMTSPYININANTNHMNNNNTNNSAVMSAVSYSKQILKQINSNNNHNHNSNNIISNTSIINKHQHIHQQQQIQIYNGPFHIGCVFNTVQQCYQYIKQSINTHNNNTNNNNTNINNTNNNNISTRSSNNNNISTSSSNNNHNNIINNMHSSINMSNSNSINNKFMYTNQRIQQQSQDDNQPQIQHQQQKQQYQYDQQQQKCDKYQSKYNNNNTYIDQQQQQYMCYNNKYVLQSTKHQHTHTHQQTHNHTNVYKNTNTNTNTKSSANTNSNTNINNNSNNINNNNINSISNNISISNMVRLSKYAVQCAGVLIKIKKIYNTNLYIADLPVYLVS